MSINEDLWATRQYGVLVGFVHHLAYFRSLSNAYAQWGQKSEFWKWTIDAHILRAIIDWCMIFGVDSSDLSWKKVLTDARAQSDFRDHLLNVLGFTNDQWGAFWCDMTDFRNQYAAHRNTTYPPVPMMDTALQVATSYDEWLRDQLDASFEEPLLRDRYERVVRTSADPLLRAVSLAPALAQEYEGRLPPLT